MRNETSKSTCSNELANIPLKAPLAALLAKELPCIERVGAIAGGPRRSCARTYGLSAGEDTHYLKHEGAHSADQAERDEGTERASAFTTTTIYFYWRRRPQAAHKGAAGRRESLFDIFSCKIPA